MATLYYYTTTATGNNWSDVTKWWTGTGGTGTNGAAPTSADDVNFDVNTYITSYTITVDATANCRDMTWANPLTGSPTLAGTLDLNIYGSLVLVSGMSFGTSSRIRFRATGGTVTITTNGVAFAALMTLGASGGTATFQLSDDFTTSGGDVNFYAGTFAANGKTFTLTGAAPTIQATVTPTFYNLVRTGTAIKTSATTLYTNITVTNNLTITGNSATNRVLVASEAIGTARTITCNGTVTVTNSTFRDITGAGSASWDISAGNNGGGTLSGCSGITFTTPATQFFYKASGNANWSDSNWFLATAGGGGAGRVPLIQDTPRFDAGSFGAADMVVTQDMPRIPGWDFTGATNTPTLTTSTAAEVYGGITNIEAMVLTASTQVYTFMGRGSYTLTSAGKTWAKVIALDAPGGTLTLQDAFLSTAAVTNTNGTLAGGAQSFTATTFTAASGATTTGTGTWILTSSGAVWTGAGTITFTGSHILKFTDATAATKTIAGGGKTYNNLWLAPGAGTGAYNFTGSNTFNDIKDDGSAAHSILFTAATTTTVSSWNVSGASGAIKTIGSITAAGHTLTKAGGGIISADYLSISRSTATPGTTWYAGANSTDGGNNSGWIFTAPPGALHSLRGIKPLKALAQ